MKVSIVIICKDEPALAGTLAALKPIVRSDDHEVIVVDASEGRLDDIKRDHPWVQWLAFERPSGVRISIPHQRNVGVRQATRDVVVSIDAGCLPQGNWLSVLLNPIEMENEDISCGAAISPGRDIYGGVAQRGTNRYLDECPTINLAFRKCVWDMVGPFDESFEYGSDVDFSWRLIASGYRIRNTPKAIVEHDWGGTRRQLKRSYMYGVARARLYTKHRDRVRGIMRRDPVAVVYSLFLIGLPLSFVFPGYLFLLVIPLWRNRRSHPVITVADHLVYAMGALREVARWKLSGR